MNTRLSLIAVASVLTLLGAGCSSQSQETPQNVADKIEKTTGQEARYCTEEPKENDIGSIEYPIAPAYWNMPHIGQIFTAMDCKNSDRANMIQWMKDGSYTAGVTLSWGDGRPSEEMRSLLIEIGFTETTPGLWQNEAPISLNDLELLRIMLQKTKQEKMPEYEDCMDCG